MLMRSILAALVLTNAFAVHASAQGVSDQHSAKSLVSPVAKCKRGDIPARLLSGVTVHDTADQLDYPPTITVTILVSLNAQGHVTAMRMLKPSVATDLNRTALHFARVARYAARLVNCKPASGTIVYKVTFWS
jgi:TonB family protein